MKFFNRVVFFISLCFYSTASLAQDTTYVITYIRRTPYINEVEATCQDEMGVAISDVRYFRNRKVFEGGYVDGGGTLTVIATRDTEGYFSCGRIGADGTVTMSSSVAILGEL